MKIKDIQAARSRYLSSRGAQPKQINIPEHCLQELLEELLATMSFKSDMQVRAEEALRSGDPQRMEAFFTEISLYNMKCRIVPTVA
ncbi:MAG: hypothetical protein ACNA8H_06935 [Anaerolineales bacterium]